MRVFVSMHICNAFEMQSNNSLVFGAIHGFPLEKTQRVHAAVTVTTG